MGHSVPKLPKVTGDIFIIVIYFHCSAIFIIVIYFHCSALLVERTFEHYGAHALQHNLDIFFTTFCKLNRMMNLIFQT